MVGQAFASAGVVTVALGGLIVSNLLVDRGLDASFARRVPGALGGLAFLIAVLWLDPRIAVALSGALTLAMLSLRLGFRRGLRGVSGSLSSQVWAEITFPAAGTVSLAVAWLLLGDRWLAFVPIAFMAWGDSFAGLARELSMSLGRRVGHWPSAAMLTCCLATGLLFQPYWIAVLGAISATAAERFCPRILSVRDDNWAVVAASLTVMGGLATAVL